MEPRWDRPLDGLDELPWAQMLGPDDAAELVAALRVLAEEGGSDHRIYGVLEDNDYDYSYATAFGRPEGFRPATVPALRFLARIAAQPSGVGSHTALELIDTIMDAALDRPTMTGDELDAMVDELRAELDAARPALAEAHRLGREGDFPVPRLLAGVDSGLLLGGGYEPRCTVRGADPATRQSWSGSTLAPADPRGRPSGRPTRSRSATRRRTVGAWRSST